MTKILFMKQIAESPWAVDSPKLGEAYREILKGGGGGHKLLKPLKVWYIKSKGWEPWHNAPLPKSALRPAT